MHRRPWSSQLLPFVVAIALASGVLGATAFAEGGDTGLPVELEPFVVELRERPVSAPGVPTNPMSSGDVHAATIFGTDDRVAVTDTTEPVWRSIVLLEAYDVFGVLVWTCSGTMVSPTAVLTAAHCLWDDLFEDYVDSVLVVPGATPFEAPFGAAWASRFAIPVGYVGEAGPQYDYGIIALDGAPFGDATGPYMTVAAMPDVAFTDPDTFIVSAGYPGDKLPGSMWFTAGFPSFVDASLIYTQMDAYPGQSGSPIYWLHSDPTAVALVGVYSTETFLSNQAVRFSPLRLQALENYCDELGCTLDTLDLTAPPPPPPPPPSPSPTVTATVATPTASATPATPTVSPTATPSPGPSPSAFDYRLLVPLLTHD